MAENDSQRRDTLLENWQKPMSSLMAADMTESDSPQRDTLQTWPKHTLSSSGKSHKRNRVRFSESSQLHIYERLPVSALQSLSYTKMDNYRFRQHALLEAMRIKNLIASVDGSASDSIRYLIRNNMIDRDDLIGIDHYVLGAPFRVRKIRKRHAAAVLQKQQELRQQGSQTLQDLPSTLGKFAQSSSLKSSKNARVRAAMSA